MSSFFDLYQSTNTKNWEQFLINTDENHISDIIKQDSIDFNDFLTLLSPAAENHLNKMAIQAKKITEKHFGKNIQLYIPLYLSNECINNCCYCGFSINNKIPRKTLSLNEIDREIQYLKNLKVKNILILTGEAPSIANLSYLKKAISKIKKNFPQVSLEIYPMNTAPYKELIDSGATGLTIYQETYNQKIYDKVHESGFKKDFQYRIETPDRALQAGFRKIGIGALLGLSDWQIEAGFLALHAKYIMKKYWRSEVNVSFPRLRDSNSGFKPYQIISDKNLVQMILALRLFLPKAGLTLSTRESSEFRDNMIGYGVTLMSAGSKTNPGGYDIHLNDPSEKQFEIKDDRDIDAVLKIIKNKGYYPVFKDWESDFQGVDFESKS